MDSIHAMRIVKALTIVPLVVCLALASLTGAPESVRIPLKKIIGEIETPKPVMLLTVPDGSMRSLLVLQGGSILILDRNLKPSGSKAFIEMSSEKMIDNSFEEGLLGIVFHPNFPKDKRFYLFHTLQNY